MDTILPSGLSFFLDEDDAHDRFLFEEGLREVRNEVKVIMLYNCNQLLKCLDEKNTQHSNLYFLELNMPLKNGMKCLIEIKKIVK